MASKKRKPAKSKKSDDMMMPGTPRMKGKMPMKKKMGKGKMK